ncbi:MAG: 30S ribosomal protein S13 [Elusimicrobia bacterium]|nr:30S ribosomal protein S13 [Elusimicrobiota bacterium]
MARVAGVDLAAHKRVDAALIRIYGIGPNNVRVILKNAQIPGETRVKNLNEAQLAALNAVIAKDFRVEGELRRDIEADIRRYIEIGCYHGQRHRRNLPVRGQRTRTNARTRRGSRRTVGAVKPGIKEAPAQPAASKQPAKKP